MAQTQLDICNSALGTVGVERIASLDEGSAAAIVLASRYEGMARSQLASYRWRFATEQALLVRRNEVPIDPRWRHAWQLPADKLAIHAVTRNGRPVEYDTFGATIFANEDEGLVATYTWRVGEAKWSPAFTEAFVTLLASVCAMSLREDSSAAETLATQAVALFASARTSDSQQQTARRLPLGRLIAVRR